MFTTELFILVMINHKMKYDDNKSSCQRMICKKLKHDSHIKIQWTRVKDLFNSLIHWRNKQDSKASSKKDLNICVVTGKKKRILKSDAQLVNTQEGNKLYNLWDFIFCQTEITVIFSGKSHL